MALTDIYTPKQIEVLKCSHSNDWFMMILHGAKRSGKTVVNNDTFLQELIRVRSIADKLGIDTPQYILAGYSMGNIQDNILTELSNKYGFKFKFDKYNNFHLFGVKVIQTSHGSISGLGRIRGMTSFGAYINEASLANEMVFDEIKSRCSGQGARVVCDTNPDHPEHWLLKDYIQSDSTGIYDFHFTLHDNTFLDERYKREIINSTPKGMFTDRNINGLWVSGDGVVYPGFDRNVHIISAEDAKKIIFDRYLCGVDWGWEHYGAIVLIGVKGKSYYVIQENAHQHKYIKDWIKVAKGIIGVYGNIPFYCDPARTEHIAAFQKAGISAFLANNRVMAGVEAIATLMTNNRFFVDYDNSPRFREEIYKYVWNPQGTEPLKLNDDVLSAIRYGIYSDICNQEVQKPNPKKTINKFRQLGL